MVEEWSATTLSAKSERRNAASSTANATSTTPAMRVDGAAAGVDPGAPAGPAP